MNHTKKLVFATNNPHKLREAKEIIADKFEILSLSEIGCHDDIPETADTLEGNALIKARWVKERYGYDCFADDTGLMVDALGGAPGVYSARYAGEGCTPTDNVKKLLAEMDGKENRKARFSTVIALLADGEEHCFEGSVEGSISTAPEGAGGFGYDPIFRADESGKCFAEMSAEEKNAISHRGRAMRKLSSWLGALLIMIIMMGANFSAGASQWRLHQSYSGDAAAIYDTRDYTYLLGYAQYYSPTSTTNSIPQIFLARYDKDDDVTTFLNDQNILTETLLRCGEYNYEKNYFMAVYHSGNIDVIYDSGEVVNIPALKVAGSDFSRNINSITFVPGSDIAYVATDFGYLEIDIKKGVVQTTHNLREKVLSVAQLGDHVLIGTEKSLYFGKPTNHSLNEMYRIPEYSNTTKMIGLGNKVYGFFGPYNNKKVVEVTPTGKGYSSRNLSTKAEKGLGRSKDKIVITGSDAIRLIGNDGTVSSLPTTGEDRGAIASTYDGTEFWFSHGRNGFSSKKKTAGGSSAEWSITRNDFMLNAANPYRSSSMEYHPDYGMLVRGANYTLSYTYGLNYTLDLICGYKNMDWTPYSTTYLTSMQGLLTQTADGVVIDPLNKNHVYSGSHLNGMLRLDLSNAENSIHMTKPSDERGGYGMPGFAVVLDDNKTPASWLKQCIFIKPSFDSQNNLWTVYVNPDKAEENNGSYTELWYWTPADRAATTSYTNVRPWHKVGFPGIRSTPGAILYAPTSTHNKNMLVYHGGNNNCDFLIVDHKGNPADRNSWETKSFASIYDQDGVQVPIFRPYTMVEDTATGLVWVGHTSGVFTIDPRANLTSPGNVRRIKVSRNDGTNLADYLLDDIAVSSIVIDSEGRKWFGTLGAGLVCTTADGRTILQTLTSENSGLADNTISAMGYNPATNSLMISTSQGLCEYFLSAGGNSGSDNSLRAYPNPVRPGYSGYVKIDGMPSNATVKITDAAGNLVKEIGQASAIGECEWDLTNNSNKRVPAGVYHIFATNGPDEADFSASTKLLIMN